MATPDDFRAWVERDITRFASLAGHVIVDCIEADSLEGGTSFRLRFFTDLHEFSITARKPKWVKVRAEGSDIQRRKLSITELEKLIDDGATFVELGPDGFANVSPAKLELDLGYLGCIASSRKPRAGEKQHRGSDLADGPLSEGTWHRILADIVSYEMVRVHRERPPTDAEIDRGQTGQPASGDVALLEERNRE